MPSTDSELRTLTPWLPEWASLKPIEDEITRVWTRLKELRAQASETKARLVASCPLELTDLELRFWSKVAIVDDENSCWPWQGSIRNVHNENYGNFRWKNPQTGANEVIGAHRISFFLTNGFLSDHARHTCDNPICVRPKHLLDGTHADNMRDRQERGRYAKKPDQCGEANDYAVLTDAIVIEARRLAREGMKRKDIAELFGVEGPTLSCAIRGKTWSHLNEVAPPADPNRGGGKLSADDVRTIRAEAAAGVPQKDLAAHFECSAALISKIVRRKHKADVV